MRREERFGKIMSGLIQVFSYVSSDLRFINPRFSMARYIIQKYYIHIKILNLVNTACVQKCIVYHNENIM